MKKNKDKIDKDDRFIDVSLRPKKLKDYVGQENIKRSLEVFIKAAQQRKQPLDHVIIHGPPGLGKTTLSNIIARELNANLRISSGPALTKIGDLASLLTNLEEGDCLFLDEIHRLPRTIEEILYPAMEDFCLDIIIGKGPAAKNLRLEIPRFTLIGATTKIGSLSSPLRDRFGVVYQLDFYSISEIKRIVAINSRKLGIEIDEDALEEIAKRSRQTPRIANRLLSRIRDYAQVENKNRIDLETTNKALNHLLIDSIGLDPLDQKIINFIYEKFNGGPVGLSTIASACGEEKETLEEVVEPYLMKIGFLHRSNRGRKLTEKAIEYLRGNNSVKKLL
ncbi:Holliday junction branch migration DNA helicase RuvB [Candidatus Berkelbacteria bacterium CG_4_8_14_3_um_filter_33_6]|uniref:Holliday junction branch migration complex subunit RuvB n=1 Tax=Candidatus Berkelbacteria bacterium CG_4_10_14_0_2_um_filter_35_9_33_12 TaxID=1974499 RepID=A0A2M7W3G4_9BACT|nr:MAG: Holliday junction branch migration DNA helicase RuvB [Candidatus Berkelbacteria bacterium CG23_combo_of_CG06-09_8_20_14_all_33_15]PIS08664.1 MAG: Holliday junction branch migration DNA helicase RuvB [Candidatus Berkelbacteria bacterium CG10_big_fil_rev_8_21_14_0_10_33_10]PIX31115.1 MAG: Holliday junction branch migration DNA helicase RuvB [Candidatus Berkelbacteria bacterium CG_4_8_14_3_um_filter_33_6]PIZ28393.1 MAG: Holliday junction branch migration DNA helicase RuvB [Candidatus Berkel